MAARFPAGRETHVTSRTLGEAHLCPEQPVPPCSPCSPSSPRSRWGWSPRPRPAPMPTVPASAHRGSSASVTLHLRRGRSLGRLVQQQLVVRRRPRRHGVLRQRLLRDDLKCHRKQVGGGLFGGGVDHQPPAPVRPRGHDDGQRLQARSRLLQQRQTAGAGPLMLQNLAASHNVKMVAVSIGGNDFNFASIVQSCVQDFTSPTWWKDYCQDDSVTANFTSGNVAAEDPHQTAFQNVRQAMRNAGYADGRGRCSSRPTPRRSPTAAASVTPRAATRRAPAVAASGTATPTGPTAPRCPRSTTP